MQPKVSVITVSYNAVSIIEDTILSVINQTYFSNIEYIIIDGGSKDGTVDVIKKYANKIAYWVSEPDKGIYDAMNKGILKASGEWINFMNAGDGFYSLDTVAEFVGKIPSDTDIAYGDTMIKLAVGDVLDKPKPIEKIVKQMVFGHQATFIRTQLHKKMLFDTTYRSSGDYNFFYQAYQSGYKFTYIPLIVANYEGEDGMSIRNIFIAKKENGRIQGKSHDIGWNISYYMQYVIYKLRKIIRSLLPQGLVVKMRQYNLKRINKSKHK